MFAHALALVTALLLVGHGPDRAWAGAPTDQLKAQIERTVKILEDPELKKPGKQRDRRAAVRQVANDIFDFSETAKRSLARHWAARSQAERDELAHRYPALARFVPSLGLGEQHGNGQRQQNHASCSDRNRHEILLLC